MIQVKVKTRTSLIRKRNDNQIAQNPSTVQMWVTKTQKKNLPVMVRDYRPRSNLVSPEVELYIKITNNSISYNTNWYPIKLHQHKPVIKTCWQGPTLLQTYCITQQNNFNKIHHKRQKLRTTICVQTTCNAMCDYAAIIVLTHEVLCVRSQMILNEIRECGKMQSGKESCNLLQWNTSKVMCMHKTHYVLVENSIKDFLNISHAFQITVTSNMK
jgi:hypothetical protein